jgi:PEP-CTERM motif
MKQFGRAALVTGLLAFGASAADASSITITDLTDGAPQFSVSSDIDVTAVTQTAESLVLFFTFHIPIGNGDVCFVPNGCPQAFNLLETSGTVSDTILLERIGSGGGADFQEFLKVTFVSDNGSPLSPLLGGKNILETGLVQALGVSTFLARGSTFDILVASDVTEVPEPGALILLGTGLAAVAARRRLRQRA